VLIVILILITVALLRYERRVNHSAVGALATQPKPSPTAVETNGDH
jgi:hypothetical protein